MGDSDDRVVPFARPANRNETPVEPGVPGAPIVNDMLVSELQSVLAMAQAGQLTSIAVALVHSNGTVSSSWCGAAGEQLHLIAAVAVLSRDVVELAGELIDE